MKTQDCPTTENCGKERLEKYSTSVAQQEGYPSTEKLW